ncbi:MAG: pyrroline-5-carboxylate reductase [Shewanella sp.]|nr:pyrroline-5-carboxylate reductase [Shewanella sp.]MCF1430016.1 pyrroline-5-carboxylate reductase [Shewanella sp.]MCF1456408.1 pyrroline-5-carboxylate reductase [Shewanella sp.]
MESRKICFIGAGNMSRAIISGLVGSGYPADAIIASNPSTPKLDALRQHFGVCVTTDNQAAVNNCEVVVLAVKPQLMQSVLAELKHIDFSNKLVISIAAGIPVDRYGEYLQQPLRLVRAMPNTPTQIGFGMTGLLRTQLSAEDTLYVEQLMSAGGKVLWVDKEADLNLVIALAGSSPAYFFLFMESMISAGEKLGMDPAQARLLAQQAALGAAQMVSHNPDTAVSTLRENVTSKGGTTAQAIATFEAGDLRHLVEQAMINCIKRAEEMADTF